MPVTYDIFDTTNDERFVIMSGLSEEQATAELARIRAEANAVTPSGNPAFGVMGQRRTFSAEPDYSEPPPPMGPPAGTPPQAFVIIDPIMDEIVLSTSDEESFTRVMQERLDADQETGVWGSHLERARELLTPMFEAQRRRREEEAQVPPDKPPSE